MRIFTDTEFRQRLFRPGSAWFLTGCWIVAIVAIVFSLGPLATMGRLRIAYLSPQRNCTAYKCRCIAWPGPVDTLENWTACVFVGLLDILCLAVVLMATGFLITGCQILFTNLYREYTAAVVEIAANPPPVDAE